MTYLWPRELVRRAGSLGWVDCSDRKDWAATQPLRRRPEAQDQLPDRPTAARVPVVKQLGHSLERAPADLDLDGRIGHQVRRPRAIERPRRDEDGAVGLLDEPDRHRAGLAAAAATGPEPKESGINGEGVVERRRALGVAGWTALGARQRLRCQDLPSVATAGAKTISTRCMSRIVRAPSAAID